MLYPIELRVRFFDGSIVRNFESLTRPVIANKRRHVFEKSRRCQFRQNRGKIGSGDFRSAHCHNIVETFRRANLILCAIVSVLSEEEVLHWIASIDRVN